MQRHFSLGFLFLLPSLYCSLSCIPGDVLAASDAEHAHEPTSCTVFGERVLLFMEYPHLVRGVPARFLAHFSVLSTGEAVRSGSVSLEIGTARFTVDAPKREGLFIPEGSLAAAGSFAARIVLQSEQATETLELGEIVVHADEAAVDQAAHAAEAAEPPNAVPFLLEQQWKLKLLLAQAGSKTMHKRLVVPACAATPEGQAALVSAPVGGRFVAPDAGALVRSGEHLTMGQGLGFIEPPLSAADLAQLQALELEFDLKALEVLRTASTAQANLHYAERERERIAVLRAEGLSTIQELEHAEQKLALSRAELASAERMQMSLERLLESRATEAQSKTDRGLRLALAAPITGTVTEMLAIPGVAVEAGQPLVRVLDSTRLWVEGRVSEFDLPLLGAAPTAVARFAALGDRAYALNEGGERPPVLGLEVDPSSRTLLVRYELDNSAGAVRPGMLAELHISTGQHAARVVIPAAAIVMDQGMPSAYVMLEGELFQKRELELGTKDGGFVEVLRGIEAGERVVTRGAYVVRLAALSPASFGAGHAH